MKRLPLCIAGVLAVMALRPTTPEADAEALPAGGPIAVENAGVPGCTSREGLARLTRREKPGSCGAVVLFFGTNDALNSRKLVPAEEYARNMAAMIRTVRQWGCRRIVVVAPPPFVAEYVRERHPNHPAADLPAHADAYADELERVAVAEEVVRIDPADLPGGADTPGSSRDSILRNEANSGVRDGVHLTAEGYRRLAARLAEEIRGRIAPGETVLCLGDSLTYGSSMEGAGTADGDTYPAVLRRLLNAPPPEPGPNSVQPPDATVPQPVH